MNKILIALLTTAAISAMAAGCTDDAAISAPPVCPSKCTEGCKDDGITCKRASFADIHATYCQYVLACMQKDNAVATIMNYMDVNGQTPSFLITNMDDCLSNTDKMNHEMGDDETVTRCKNVYSDFLQCMGENTCNPNGTTVSFCLDQKDAMLKCFEKRTSPSQIEDVWGYKAFCATTANCVQQNKSEISLSLKTGVVNASFAWWTSDGCETRFERLLLTPYRKEMMACGQEFSAYLSCLTTRRQANCAMGSGNEECKDQGGVAYNCLVNLK